MPDPGSFTLRSFQGCIAPDFNEAIRIRTEVFIVEQEAPPDTEPDAQDTDACHHWLVYKPGKAEAIATGRMFADKEGASIVHIGRMAVLKPYRGKGLGHLILKEMLEKAPGLGFKTAILEAQSYAKPFYAKLGFKPEGEEFILDNIPHIWMRKNLLSN